MRLRTLPSPAVLAFLALAAPQAAMAKLEASFIKVEDGGWTLLKYSTSRGGKLKIYAELPKYTLLGKIETKPVAELKALHSNFTFEAGKKYWLVFFPKYTKVSQIYLLAKDAATRGYTTDYQVYVTQGQYHALTWTSTPKFQIFIGNNKPRVLKLAPENFEKGKQELPLLTILKNADASAGTQSSSSKPDSQATALDEGKIHDFEIDLRKRKNLNAVDPEGMAPESMSVVEAGSDRDYWRLLIQPDKEFHDRELNANFDYLVTIYSPDKNNNSKEATEAFNNLKNSYERLRWESIEGQQKFNADHPEKDDED